MMRQLLAVISPLILVGSAFGQSVTLPAEIKGSPGAWVIVAPEKTEGGKPRWRIDPGLQEVRLDLLLPPETLAQLRGKVVTAAIPGRYRVEAWNAKGDIASEIATCWVVIGDPGPPIPPKPPPKPDALVEALRAAYAADSDLNKAKHKATLAELYHQASAVTVYDPTVKTFGELYARLRKAAQALMSDAALGPVRQVLAKELSATLSVKPEAELTAANRSEAAAAFSRIAAALKEVP